MAEEVNDHFRHASELGAKVSALGGNARRAGVEVALAGHVATDGDDRTGTEPIFLGTKQGSHDDVSTGLHAPIGTEPHPSSQSVENENLLRFGQAHFPRASGVLDARQRTCSGAPVVAGDKDVIGVCLGNPRGNRAYTRLRDELYSDLGPWIGRFEVVDQLGKVLDGVDVVVWWRTDQRDPGDGVAQAGNEGCDLGGRDLSALTGLGPLCHLDLEFFCLLEIFGCHAEASTRHLLDLGVCALALVRAVREWLPPVRVLTTFAGV